MHPRQVTVEVFHPAEGVVSLWTPSDMAEERPFSVQIGDTDVGVLLHALPHIETLAAKWTRKGLIPLRSIHPMGHLVVLQHPLL